MVEGIRPVRVSGPPRVDGGLPVAGADRFAISLDGAPAGNIGPLSGVPVIGLEGMLALQAVDEALERDKAARKRGSAMIAALTDLQRALLAAEDPALTLRSLSDLAASDPDAADPGLASVLRAVILRARVEVARRERRGDQA